MRTMHPVLKRGGLYWDRALLPPSAYEARFRNVQRAIAASGDDAWLVYGDVETYGALAWFSNFLPRTRSALALVPREGAPTLLLSVGLRDVPAAKTLTWIDDARPFTRLPRTLVGLIEEKRLASARIGLACVEELLPIKDWNEISKALPNAHFVSRTRALSDLRARKDDCEIEAVRRAAKIVSGALDLFANALKPGLAMRAATAQVDRYLRANGAEDLRIMVAGGEQTGASLRPADDRVLKQGDAILLYVAAETQRYWAEGARTFVLGAASEAQRRLAANAETALAAMRAAIKPGVTAASIARAGEDTLANDVLRASARGYGFGDGIGLDLAEAPSFTSDESMVEASTFALRVIAHADGMGVALGETIILRDGAIERLIEAPGLVERSP